MANPLQIFRDIEELGKAGQEAAQAPSLYRDTLGVGRDIVKAKAPANDAAPYIELPPELHELRPPAAMQPPASPGGAPHSQTMAREFSSENRTTPLDQDIARLMGELQDVPGASRHEHVHNWMRQRFAEAWDHESGGWHDSVKNEMKDFHQSILDSFAVQQRARSSMERARWKLAARPGEPHEPGLGDPYGMTPNEVRADEQRKGAATMATTGVILGGGLLGGSQILSQRDAKRRAKGIQNPPSAPPPSNQGPTDWGAQPGALWTPSKATDDPYETIRKAEDEFGWGG